MMKTLPTTVLGGLLLGSLLFAFAYACFVGLGQTKLPSPWLWFVVFPIAPSGAFLVAGWLAGRKRILDGAGSAVIVALPTVYFVLFLAAGAKFETWILNSGSIGVLVFLLYWTGVKLPRAWRGMRRRLPMRPIRIAFVCMGALFAVNAAFWLLSARSNLTSHACMALIVEHDRMRSDANRHDCVAVEPALFERTPPRLRQAVREQLATTGTELRVSPPTGGGDFRERECVEYYVGVQSLDSGALNLPGVAVATISYNTYHGYGDLVLLLQVGPRWIYLKSWNLWS